MSVLVNLFDENFRHDVCSVAGKASQNVVYSRDNMSWDGVTIFTDAYIHDKIVDLVKSPIKIGWLHEPRCLWPNNYKLSEEILGKFDFILTYVQEMVDSDPDRIKFCPYGGIWLPREEWGIRPKKKNVSMLIGSKKSTEGHKIRHAIHDAIVRSELDYLVDFYGVYGTPVNYGWRTKLRVLGDYKYTIISETCRESNLFTEILLDCFAVGTIPIMWGSADEQRFISETFGHNSIVWFDGVRDVIDMLNWWPLDYIGDREEAMEAAKEFEVTEDWIYNNYLVYL